MAVLDPWVTAEGTATRGMVLASLASSKKNHFTFKPYSLPQLTMNQHSEALHVHVTNSSDSVGILNKYLKRSSRMSLMKLDLENTSFSEYCEVMEPILCILLYTRHVLRKSLQQRSFEE